MPLPQRPLSLLVAALLTLAAPGAHAQVHASEAPAPRPAAPANTPGDRDTPAPAATAASPAPNPLAEARVFPFDAMPVRTSPNGAQSRTVTHGTLATGESVNLHESTQPAGTPAGPLHAIHHTEFVCVVAGELEFQHVDAHGATLTEHAGPGSVIFVANGTTHSIHNAGSTPAQYIVVAIGGDAK